MASKPNWLAQAISFRGSPGTPTGPQARHSVNLRRALAGAAARAPIALKPKLAKVAVLIKRLRLTRLREVFMADLDAGATARYSQWLRGVCQRC